MKKSLLFWLLRHTLLGTGGLYGLVKCLLSSCIPSISLSSHSLSLSNTPIIVAWQRPSFSSPSFHSSCDCPTFSLPGSLHLVNLSVQSHDVGLQPLVNTTHTVVLIFHSLQIKIARPKSNPKVPVMSSHSTHCLRNKSTPLYISFFSLYLCSYVCIMSK